MLIHRVHGGEGGWWLTFDRDLWTLAGVTAIKEMGGPDIEWKSGRTDYVDDSKLPPHG